MGLAKVAYASYVMKVNAKVTFASYLQMCHWLKVDKIILVIGQLFFSLS